MRLTNMILASTLAIATAASAETAPPLSMGAPLGAAWGATYGFPPAKDVAFVAPARALGAGFTRVTLYWSQLAPRPGVQRWDDLDAYVAQLGSRDEGIVTLASASPWATRVPAWVFPSSPARDPEAYEAFVRDVVRHVAGRVKYFQNDPEPNNPFFWNGTIDQFVAQQKSFHRAVKEADPGAVVVLAGCDGLFDPTGQAPMPGQQASLAYFTRLIADAADAYDVFDLRLYGDPYTIPARVAFVRGLMDRAGGHQPIIATEYAGPTFFEFPANRRWFAASQGPAAATLVRDLVAQADTLPIETRMFLPGASADAAERLRTLQSRDLVVRNLVALASGVQKTAFWDLWHDAADVDSFNTVQYGALRLLSYAEREPLKPTTLGLRFTQLAAKLGDATRVRRVPLVGQVELYLFEVERSRGLPLWVAWRRPDHPQDVLAPVPMRLPGIAGAARASTLSGEPVALGTDDNGVVVPLGSEPLFIE